MDKIKAVSCCSHIAALLTGFLCMFMNLGHIHASDCGILEVTMYESEQDVIGTDWYQEIAYKKYQKEVYPCAHANVRSNSQLGISTEDIEIIATFTDRNTAGKEFHCKERRLEKGDEYSCGICFESIFPIDSLECAIK